MRGSTVSTEAACCCKNAPTCVCTSLYFKNKTVRITLSLPWAYPFCITTPINIPIDEVILCSAGIFSRYITLDTDLCVGEGIHCAYVTVFLRITGTGCNCTNTDACTVELAGWEDGCAGSIANVELI